jgi:transcription termination factor Rho
MPVLSRPALEASPLADLHAIASELGIDGFRRLRKSDLVDAILDRQGGDGGDGAEPEADAEPRTRRRRPSRARTRAAGDDETAAAEEAPRPRRSRARRAAAEDEPSTDGERIAEGVVEVQGNGSGFLRVDAAGPSDDDVYLSAAQVRRCELVSGDRVTGPVRLPRRSERYPSLVRVDTINGAPADEVAAATPFDDLPAVWPAERIALDADDATLKAIEWLTPIGRGSRVTIVGAARSGKSEALRRLAAALAGREGLEVSAVLAGVRPEEAAEWQAGSLQPVAALTFAASADAQSQAVERAIDAGKRVASRGGHAVVLVDGLDGLNPTAARKALAAARSLGPDQGSLTVIATAGAPQGGETTVIALDPALTQTGRFPALDLVASGTLRPELLVGEGGAEEIARARAKALED